MNQEPIIKYLNFAIKKHKTVKIKTRNQKELKVKVLEMNERLVKYSFINSSNASYIKLENIESINFTNKKDIQEFIESLIEEKYETPHLMMIIENFKNYYLEVIQRLLEKETKNSIGYISLKMKEDVYPKIFNNLKMETENLLYYYFSQKRVPSVKKNKNQENKEMLLIEQANRSQKKSINNSINERVSIIEGPPGTGKTTTILNILSNLIYQNKKVLVVSKNNSAIENVVEELQKMDIPKCYIRLGNSTIMAEQVEENITEILNRLDNELQENELIDFNESKNKLIEIIADLDKKEEKLTKLIDKCNELQELKNQLRHVEKTKNSYSVDEDSIKIVQKYKKLRLIKLKKIISILAKILIILDEKEKLNVFEKIVSYVLLRIKEKDLKNDGIAIHLILEEYYLKSTIEVLEKQLENEKFEELKQKITEMYLQEYIPISRRILKSKVKENMDMELLQKCIKYVQANKDTEKTVQNPTPKVNSCKNDLLKLYPIVLTTADSVVSNYKKYFENGEKIDYVIIDESSQCDILTAIPVLYLAKQLIVVGDLKQLSAITDVNEKYLKNQVDEKYKYSKQNLLSSIEQTMEPASQMLLEHYRCDYNIINYCNKYFYDNKLKIYKTSNKSSMSVIDDDKGKYVDLNEGYKNEREIKTINSQIDNNIENKFIITPFRKQADILREKYGKERCGTIHTFQGKGEKEVYFSAVLNNTKVCINHLKGANNLFTKQLINVAVSRAKDKFVLVADKEFFKKNDENMKNLIEYIETYGETIPDKTVCIFDYLYKEIESYQQVIPSIDNPFEEKIHELISKFISKKEGKYKMAWKLPLAEFVTDKKFLDENEELRRFILHNSHLDFAIYSQTINKPILAIEVDGKDHEKIEQKERDEKKEKILKYMEIPLIRIKSKAAFEENELYDEIEKYVK